MKVRLLIIACLALIGGVAFYWLGSERPESPVQLSPASQSTSVADRTVAPEAPRVTVADSAPSTAEVPSAAGSASAGNLLAPVRPADGRTLDGVSGTVATASGSHKLRGTEGLFDRIMISEDETISLRLEVPNLQPGEEVVITASNGGRLERLNGPLRFVPAEDSALLELALTPTTGRGVYNIDIRQAGAVASLRFWAGEPLPVGEPGPNFQPLPPQPETIP